MSRTWDDPDRLRAFTTGALELEGAAIARLEAAIQRVRDMHRREPLMDFGWCNRCDQRWPCDTIRALDGETE
ncbi:MAG: hypothetical protein ACR2IJ_02380 [Fluviibacter sp.]